LPLDDLVVLDVDVVAEAAGVAVVGLLVVLYKLGFDNSLLVHELGVNGDKHLTPFSLEVDDQLLVD